MSNLKSTLLNTIKGVNASFDAALADLQEMAAEADDAVKALSPDLAIRLAQRERYTSGTLYLLAVTRGKLSEEIAYYKIPRDGYPIRFGSSERELAASRESREIKDKAALSAHFEKMSADKNSPFVSAVAYLLRG